MSLERFIELWVHPKYPPRPVSDEGLSTVEKRYGIRFPMDYRDAVLRHGLVSPTIALLDAIVDRELDMSDLSELLDPGEMMARTDDWREMGLPADMVAFASDCSGNLFCFCTNPDTRGVTGAPIFLFDHDFGTTEVISPAFADWIEAFCRLSAD